MAVKKIGKFWHVRFEMQPYGEIKRSSKSTVRAEAVKYEKALRQKLQNEIRTGQLPNQKSWDDAVIRWIEAGAQQSWQPKIDQLTPYFEGTLLVDAPKIASEMTHQLLLKGLKPTTINRRLAAVRRVLRLAHREWDWIDQPLADKIQLQSEKGTAREIYLSKAEVKAIFNGMVAQHKPSFQKNASKVKIALLLMVNTGMRKSELLRLQPEDWKPPNLLVRQSKSGKPRAVPVPEMVHWICEDHLPIQATGSMMRSWWETGRAAAGLQHVRMHDLRHTFASWYAENPESTLQQLRDILGHSNLAVTSRYTHVMGNSLPAVNGLNLEI